MTHETRIQWLKIASYALIVFGLAFALLTGGGWEAGTALFLDTAFWPVDGAQSLAAPEAKLLVAIVGGLTVGLGVFILTVTNKVYDSDPQLGRALILSFGVPWIVVDSIGSAIAGAWFNVILNIFFALLVLAPVLTQSPAAGRQQAA